MSHQAVRRPSVPPPGSPLTSRVLSAAHGLQVGWVDTCGVPAEVIECVTVDDRSHEFSVDDAVRTVRPNAAAHLDDSVPTVIERPAEQPAVIHVLDSSQDTKVRRGSLARHVSECIN
jgi:hypothetical protein